MIIDTDHWRHFYVLMAIVWGLMAASRRPRPVNCPARARASCSRSSACRQPPPPQHHRAGAAPGLSARFRR